MSKVDAVYIHIPFCNYICAYCDFCKIFYNKEYVNRYLDALDQEIINNYKGEVITSLYIGGGTPSSLDLEELEKLLKTLKIFNLSKDCEITFESNADSLSLDKIKLLKDFGVNRVSLGVETINKKLQDVLERRTSKDNVINCINNLKRVGITNINVDLIYAIKGETLEDLNNDLEFLLSLDVPHISTYSLIIEDNTKLKIKGIKNIDKVIDRDMYDLISKTLKNNNYIHYEISNFSYDCFMSKHNLKYWRNLEYYGFGVGASGYIDNIRYTNTRSITNYIDGKTIIDREIVTLKDKMFYEIMLGFRTSMGIDKIEFKDKYNVSIDRVFNYKSLVEEKVLEEDLKCLRVREEYFYVLDEVTLRFLDTLQTNVSFDIIS